MKVHRMLSEYLHARMKVLQAGMGKDASWNAHPFWLVVPCENTFLLVIGRVLDSEPVLAVI